MSDDEIIKLCSILGRIIFFGFMFYIIDMRGTKS